MAATLQKSRWPSGPSRDNPLVLLLPRPPAPILRVLMSVTATPLRIRRRLRRSKRLGLSVPVRVHGTNVFGEPFHEFTDVISVSAHGALVALGSVVEKGQTILVENRSTREEQEFRVVYVADAQEGKYRVGIEFLHGPVDFWRIYFPPVRGRD